MERDRGDLIQVCGRLVIVLHGERLEHRLPSRQGRALFAYLVVHRAGTVTRDALIDAVWGERPPAAADNALSALLSKLRRVLGSDVIEGRDGPRLVLPAGTSVDLEAANEAIHRAESAVASEEWAEAWGPARVALHTASRGFLPGYDAPWIEEMRRSLEDLRVRALECVAQTGLGLGGPELASTERAARTLIRTAPFRESGYRYLMQALSAQGNLAEALQVHEQLRNLLRDELGIAPGPETRELAARLLRHEP